MKINTRRRFLGFSRKDLFELFVCLLLSGLFVLLSSGTAFGQGNVGINNPTPHAKSLLDLTSSDKGLLTPRLTAAQRTAMFGGPDATAKGMLVYQTDGTQGYYYYDGAAWQMLQAGGAGWGLTGNAGTNPATHFLGTTDNQGLAFRANNTEHMRIAPNGNVGIGYNSPNFKLDVLGTVPNGYMAAIRNLDATGFSTLTMFNHTATAQAYFGMYNPTGIGYAGTATAHPFSINTNNAERMRIAANGNVGIGHTSPAYNLDIRSTTQAVTRLTSQNHIYGSVLVLDNTTPGNNALGAVNFGDGTNALGQLNYHLTNGMTFSVAAAERMRIDVAGNVGIGTTAPSSKLHVSRGAAGYAPNANSGLTVEHSGSVYANVISATGETGLLFGSAANAAHGGIVYNSVPGMMFRTGGNLERMRIDAAGNVGIGTSTPSVKLDVVDGNWLIPMRVRNTLPTGYTAVQYINNNNKFGNIGWGNSAAATFADKFYVGTTSPEPMLFTTGDVERARIDAAGNVGIGTTTPGSKLHVSRGASGLVPHALAAATVESAGNTYQHFLTPGNSESGLLFGSGATAVDAGVLYHTAASLNGLDFRTGGNATRMVIKSNGLVGIGTAAPTAELEVNGFTKHGTNAPAIKQVEFTGTTAATEGAFVDIVHGLTVGKIIDVRVLIEYTAGNWITTGYTINPEFLADYVIGTTNIRLYNHNGSSGSILSKPVKVLVTYKA